MYRPVILGALGLAVALLVGGPAAASERGDVMKTAREQHRALLALADTPGGKARVEARLAELIDAEAIGAAVIGGAPVTAEQRRVLQALLGRVAAQRFRRALMSHRGRAIARVDASDGPGGAHRVAIVPGPTPGQPPAAGLEFAMRDRGGRMRVVDVYTDGVGLVANYSQIMGLKGLPPVVEKAQAELGDPPGPPPPPPPPPAQPAPPTDRAPAPR